MDKIKKMIGGWYIWRKRISAALACIVVFTTVYAMVLPAITLDQDTADQENGIELDEDSETTEQETALEEAENSEEEAAEEVSEEEYTVEEYTEEDTWDFAEGPITLQWPDELAEAEAVSYSDEDDEEDEIDYTVTATFDEESGLPEDVRLQVAEIKKGTEEYEYYLQSALEAVRKEGGDETAISYARFFDITFITDEGEIEPTGPVNIVIEYEDEKELKAETAEDLSVVHFDQEEQEEPVLMEIETEVEGEQVQSITFDSDAFSVYGVLGTYTVEIDGEAEVGDEHLELSHNTSLIGGESILLSSLLEAAWPEREELRVGNISDVTAGETSAEDGAEEKDFLKITSKENGDYEISADTSQEENLSGKKGTFTVRFKDGSVTVLRFTVSGTPDVCTDLAVISSADGAYLPDSAEGFAEELPEEKISVLAEDTIEKAGDDTVSKVFEISLNLTEEEQAVYEDGFLVNLTLPEKVTGRDFHLYHIHDGKTEELAIDKTGSEPDETGLETVSEIQFVTDSFSEFVLQYTVDFEYSVNGKMYRFSLPGGGFVSFTDLVEVLGIIGDTNSEENGDENGAVITENGEENGINEGAEEDGIDSDTNTALTLGDVEVSEATRKFVANVANVKFSSPELVDVSKVENETTVGQIKESRGLEVEYSAELTEEQITEINAQTVEAGDWALISVKPFDTEESLTVTMKTGEVFQITVTDDQENPYGLDGKAFAITAYKNSNSTYYFISSDGTGISSSNNNCLKAYNFNPSSGGTPQGSSWTFEWTGEGKKYLIHDNQNRYIVIENDRVILTDKDTALDNPITVVSREGKYSFVNEKNNHALNIFGDSGFGSWTYSEGNSDFLMTLQNPSNMKTPGTIDTADTSGLLQINLFDYGPENELDKEANNNSSPYAYGINSGHTLKFFSYGKNVGNGVNDFTGAGNGPQTGIVADQLSGNYPVLASNTSESLAYLFGGESNNYVTSYTGLNHLFTKDENGYYHYNSDQNYAYLDGSNFKVYSKTFPEEGADEQYFGVGFFPFNDYDEYYNCIHGKDGFERWDPHSNGTNPKKNGHYNHHFGMSLKGNFIMPPGRQYNGKDVTFQFSGDDDMWVYVDGVLIMDIGGVHNPVHGEINFTTGEVTVHGAAQENFKEKYKRITGNDWDDSDFSNHDFRVFYMERGGMYSNLEVTFNLPLTPKTETNNFQFDKVSSENESLKLSGAEFSLFNDPSCSDPFTLASVPVKATSDKNGVVSFKNIPHGTYYMKETVYPEGYQAKTPEEIFTVVVNASGGTITSSSGDSISQVTNKPKKIDVEVEKVWSNGIVPSGAEIEIVLGRYKLVEDPNAPGTATLVIKDSYTGLPSGSNYHVTYTITGPDGYSNTITKSYTDSSKQIEESVEVPATVAGSQYTVTKQVQNISYHNINNQNQTVNVTVAKNGTGQTQFNQSTFTRNAYRVRIYAVNSTDPNNLYSENYYPAGSNLSLRIDHKNYNWGFFSFTVSSNTGWNSGTYTSDSQQQFTSNLNQDIDLVLHCSRSDWTKGHDWIKDPYITGANPVRAASAGRMMMSMRRGASAQSMSQTASAPTLPDPPQNTLYVLDEEYAANPDKITLSGGTWTGKAEELDAYNEYGPYVYYIASVNESGMPEGTQITIEDEVSLDGSAKVLTVTNNVPTGDLQITKNIQKNGTTDTSATGTFYYAVFDEEYNPDANPAQTPVRTGSIEVTQGGTKTVTESGLYYGTYYVYELTAQNGTPIISGADGVDQVIGNVKYIVTGSGTSTSVSGTDGTVNLTNNHEIGFLKIKKVVKFDGHDPTNATVPGTNPAQSEKQILAGEYKFKIFSNEGLTTQVGALTITVLNDGQVVYSNPIELPVGQYWIEEEAVVGKPIYPIEDNPRSVTITTQNTSELAKEFEVTNDYYVNSDEDTYTIDIEKRFEGLTEDEIPSNFQMVLQYQMEGVETPREIILHKNLRGIQQDGIVATFEKDSTGTNWVWHLMDIPSKASGFQIKEENYNKLGLACNTFRLNRTETSSTEQQIENPDQYMAVNMTGPDNVGFYEVTSEKRYTPDNNTSFWIDEGTVLLVSLTGSHAGTAVISLTALNNIEREAIRHSIPLSEGSFAQPVYFYSIEQHPNSITPNNNRRITVGEVNGRKYVTMKKSGSSMEGVFEVTYYGESTFNNEIIINKYSENTEIDIVKVTNDTLDQETKTPLEDAVFQITQLNEQSTASHVFYLTKTEGGTQVPVYQRTTDPTDSDGKASFTGLSSGYYEIKEIASPGGYILLGDVIYVHINHGTVTYLKKPETETDPDKPIAEWESITSGVNVRFEAAQEATQTTEASNATFTIGNEPGAALPSTGGSGTRLFTSLGSILILGAGVLLWRRRRLI